MLIFWLLAASQVIIFSIYSVNVACDEGGDKKTRFVRNCIILAITLTATYFVPWDLIN